MIDQEEKLKIVRRILLAATKAIENSIELGVDEKVYRAISPYLFDDDGKSPIVHACNKILEKGRAEGAEYFNLLYMCTQEASVNLIYYGQNGEEIPYPTPSDAILQQ